MLEKTTRDARGDMHPRADADGNKPLRIDRVRWGLIVPALLLAALLTWLTHGGKPPKRIAAAVVPVSTARATVRDFEVAISALGRAKAWQSVLIRAQVNGSLLRVPVAEGSEVERGDLIAEIDPSLYQAALLQAQGTLTKDRAALAEARLDLARDRLLDRENSISQQQVDLQAATVKQDEGIVMADRGSVDAAKANLGYTRIVAPVSGRVGIRLVDPGNLVSSTDTGGIISIDQVTPIAVTFTIPEGDFQHLATVSRDFRLPLATQAYSQEDNTLLGTGALVVADNHVDPATATVEMKARFPNESRTLWPGQFVNVRLTVQVLHRVLTVPARAVNQGPDGPFVYVVQAGAVAVRPVTVARTQDGVAVLSRGVSPGETVVTDGQLALRDGVKVRTKVAKGEKKR